MKYDFDENSLRQLLGNCCEEHRKFNETNLFEFIQSSIDKAVKKALQEKETHD